MAATKYFNVMDPRLKYSGMTLRMMTSRAGQGMPEHIRAKVEPNAWQWDPSTGTICRYPIKNILRVSASQTPGDQK